MNHGIVENVQICREMSVLQQEKTLLDDDGLMILDKWIMLLIEWISKSINFDFYVLKKLTDLRLGWLATLFHAFFAL